MVIKRSRKRSKSRTRKSRSRTRRSRTRTRRSRSRSRRSRTPKGRLELRGEPGAAKLLHRYLPKSVTLRKKVWIPSKSISSLTYCWVGGTQSGKNVWKYCGLRRK